jgi:DNA-binding CsgD family transcriptional regulator
MAIPDRSIGRLLTLLPSLYASQSLEKFPRHALTWIRYLIDADSVAFNVVDLARQEVAIEMDPAVTEFGPDDFESTASATIDEHPLIAHFARTLEARALRLSDFVTRRQLHRRRIYQETLRPLRIEYLLAAPFLDPDTQNHIAISLARESVDFDDHERETLDLLLPHFAQAYLNARAIGRARSPFAHSGDTAEASAGALVIPIHNGAPIDLSPLALRLLEKYFPGEARTTAASLPEALELWMRYRECAFKTARGILEPCRPWTVYTATGRLEIRLLRGSAPGEMSLFLNETELRDQPRHLEERLGLSQREASVLLWIAQGKTSAEAAQILAISRRTVDKHLERVYQKLRVESRVAAAALAWEALHVSQDFPRGQVLAEH